MYRDVVASEKAEERAGKSVYPYLYPCWLLLDFVDLVANHHPSQLPIMNEDKALKGGAFELLSWATPAQFHFIVDQYNNFVEIARDDGERAKFWTSLEDDWSSVWDFTPEIMQVSMELYELD